MEEVFAKHTGKPTQTIEWLATVNKIELLNYYANGRRSKQNQNEWGTMQDINHIEGLVSYQV